MDKAPVQVQRQTGHRGSPLRQDIGSQPSPHPAAIGDLWWSTFLRWALANLAGSSLTFLLHSNLLPGQGPVGDWDLALPGLLLFIIVVVGPLGGLQIWRYLRAIEPWLTARPARPPSPFERDAALALPWKLARDSLIYWGAGSVLYSIAYVVFRVGPAEIAREAVIGLDAGLTTSAAVFLLVEHSLRPVFANALAFGAPAPARVGLRMRLMLVWALGSAVPLVLIILEVLVPREAGSLSGILFLAVVGLAVGGLLTWTAARSISDRVERLRAALLRVDAGDLDVQVTIDQPGEVGMLQAGFNNMVGGLRERWLIEDLFGRHVGIEVAHKALESGLELGGEQREASALFVDLAGSTALAEQLAPTELVAALNAVFAAVVSAARAHGGWVNKFEGDGALCVFGVPTAAEDHQAEALRAGRELHARLGALRSTYPYLDAGIGVSSGLVVAGNIGAADRYEYTVIGDPVNIAARLTEAAKLEPGRVLAGGETVAAAGEEADAWESLGAIELRGRKAPVEAYAPRALDDEGRR